MSYGAWLNGGHLRPGHKSRPPEPKTEAKADPGRRRRRFWGLVCVLSGIGVLVCIVFSVLLWIARGQS